MLKRLAPVLNFLWPARAGWGRRAVSEKIAVLLLTCENSTLPDEEYM